MAKGITNDLIDNIYNTAIKAGASGGKISGAGGGGFMLFYCPGNTRYDLEKSLKPLGAEIVRYNFLQKDLLHGQALNNKAKYRRFDCIEITSAGR